MSEHEEAVAQRWTDREFAQWWEQSRSGLLGLCAREMHGHLADAEDALGNAALAALRSARATELPRSPPAWLSHIVRHACIDMHRARRRRSGRLGDLVEGEPVPEPEARPGTDPESLVLGRETALRVRDAVASLPPHLSRPFLLRVEEQVPYAGIARLLGDSVENLRKRVQLARQHVREALERDEGFRGAPGRRRNEREPGDRSGHSAKDVHTPALRAPSDAGDRP